MKCQIINFVQNLKPSKLKFQSRFGILRPNSKGKWEKLESKLYIYLSIYYSLRLFSNIAK